MRTSVGPERQSLSIQHRVPHRQAPRPVSEIRHSLGDILQLPRENAVLIAALVDLNMRLLQRYPPMLPEKMKACRMALVARPEAFATALSSRPSKAAWRITPTSSRARNCRSSGWREQTDGRVGPSSFRSSQAPARLPLRSIHCRHPAVTTVHRWPDLRLWISAAQPIRHLFFLRQRAQRYSAASVVSRPWVCLRSAASRWIFSVFLAVARTSFTALTNCVNPMIHCTGAYLREQAQSDPYMRAYVDLRGRTQEIPVELAG